MLIARIFGFTRVLAENQPEYLSMPIRDEMGPHGAQMVSAWEPTEQELARLVNGAKIELKVLGTIHPAVSVEVGDVP